ncbi:hypothetical protein PPBDW_I21002 [Photobacterium kishitanii]|nr:hypothetical protein PPBDW_I21002 [Photobacterium kishitanii]
MICCHLLPIKSLITAAITSLTIASIVYLTTANTRARHIKKIKLLHVDSLFSHSNLAVLKSYKYAPNVIKNNDNVFIVNLICYFVVLIFSH